MLPRLLPFAILLTIPAVSFGQIGTPTSEFGSNVNSSLGQSISNPGDNMFSTPLPSPTLGSLDSSGTGGTGSTGSSAGGLGSDASATASALMQQNAVNPFAATQGTGAAGAGNAASRSGLNSFGRLGGFANLFGAQAFGANQDNQQKRLPTKLTVRFDHPELSSAMVDRRLTTRVQNLRFPEVSVGLEGRVAILSGVVDTEDDSRLLERFVAMEPGVSSVENRLEVRAVEILP